jgi:hypothetical protein
MRLPMTIFVILIVCSTSMAGELEEQKNILQETIKAGCSVPSLDIFALRACSKDGQSISDQLLNPDKIMFEKNLAGLTAHICSRFTGESEMECFEKSLEASKSQSLHEMYRTFELAAEYDWIYSTKFRRFLFTTGKEQYPTQGASNWFYYHKYNPLFLKILIDYANPQLLNTDYHEVLRSNGIDPDEDYLIKMITSK